MYHSFDDDGICRKCGMSEPYFHWQRSSCQGDKKKEKKMLYFAATIVPNTKPNRDVTPYSYLSMAGFFTKHDAASAAVGKLLIQNRQSGYSQARAIIAEVVEEVAISTPVFDTKAFKP